jgi:hypothetical protein
MVLQNESVEASAGARKTTRSSGPVKLTDHVTFRDTKLAARYAHGPMPMATLCEAYFDGDLDIPGDIQEFIAQRKHLVSYRIERRHIEWLVTHFLPEALIHTQQQDTRIVREHYDRGNDFFEWFLGPRMVYTSAYFRDPSESVEQAQDNKLKLVCDKLQLQPGERLLDIGCGWGTLARYAAQHYGAIATGVTISQRQAEYGNEQIAKAGLGDRARIVCQDGGARGREKPAFVLRAGAPPERRRRPVRAAVDGAAPRLSPGRPGLDHVHGQVYLPGCRREPVPLCHAEADREGRLGAAQRRERQHPLQLDDPALARALAAQ